jgi:PAS domain S-box-containing protein
MGTPLRVLVAEDSENDARLLLHELKRAGYEADHLRVDSASAMSAALDSQGWDLVISDYHMPTFSGTAALALVRERQIEVPFIFVSGTIGEDVAVEAMRAGAQDYVMKGNLRRLGPAIQRELEEARTRRQRRRAEEAIAVQQSVTRVLAESSGMADAIPRILSTIGSSLQWDLGGLWMVNRDTGVLDCVGIWQASPGLESADFEALSRSQSLDRGDCLPGKVWAAGAPLWIPDIARADGLVGERAALVAGLRAACGFPIRNGAEPIGVCEFFSHRIQEPEAYLLEMMAAVGSQIGQFVERRRAEEALGSAQARLRQVLASSTAVVYSMSVRDRGFIPVWVSENVTRLLGYSPQEALQPTWWLAHVHPDDRALVLGELSRLFDQQGMSLEYRFKHNNGTYRWVHDQSRLYIGTEGAPTELFGALLDVTERRRLEDQFRQAQKLEAVGRLAGGVAHDFNNLLTVISGHATFLREDLGRDQARQQDVLAIEQAAREAAGLTRQLLAFSRQQVLEARVLDLNEAVAESERMLTRVIGEDVALVTVLDPALGRIRADPGQIGQVIMNLAVNARDAMPEGGRLTIETANATMDAEYAQSHMPATEGRYVMLAISDTGIGMDEDTKARIFEPFFTTKEAGKGTGLGLATVYGIVKQSGGFIWVYSEPAQGTCFKIYLPRVDEAVDWHAARSEVSDTPRGTETVLLVEDAAQLRAVSRKVLQRQGYRVIEAPDGEAALAVAAAESGPIHLVLTDVVMPGLGGRRLAGELTRLRPEVKVLYTSGYTDDAIVRHGVLEAGVAYLQKPFTPEVLARKVREVLDDSRAG